MAKRPPEPEPAEAGLSRILELLSFLVVVVTFPISLFFTLKTTKEYERVVIFRLGRSLGRARGPGLYFVLPCLDRCSVVDLRTRTHSVPRQEVYTLDGVTVHVSAVLTYRVVEARLAVTAVENCHASTKVGIFFGQKKTILDEKNFFGSKKQKMGQNLNFIVA